MTASLTKVSIFIIFSLSEKLDLRMVASCYRSHGSVGALDPAGASWKACPCGVLVT